MKLNLGNPFKVTDEFEYLATVFVNGVSYGVHWEGRLIGDVTRYEGVDNEWYATPDQGDMSTRRWYGVFPTRVAAARFLVGGYVEREQPAWLKTCEVRRLLRERVTRPVDESLPEERRSELAFRRAVPTRVPGGFEIVWVGQWEPGGPGYYATAIVVTRYGEEFTTHRLIWSYDNRDPDYRWTLEAGNYGLSTLEQARWDAAVRLAM